MRIVSDKLLCHGNGPGNRNDVECVLVCIKRPIRRQIQMQWQRQIHAEIQRYMDTVKDLGWMEGVCHAIGDFKDCPQKSGIEFWHIVRIPFQIRNTF